MATQPKVLGFTLVPKLTYSTHIHNISVHAHKPLIIIIKVLTTLIATIALVYASSMWSPLIQLKVMQNAALKISTGCTQDTNIHLHDETLTLPIHEHLHLHASQYKQKPQYSSYPLHKHTTYFQESKGQTPSIFNNGRYTTCNHKRQ